MKLSRLRIAAVAPLFVILASAAHIASAQETLRIVAVVNDEVISDRDLATRTRLAAIASGATPTTEIMDQIRSQVLRALIDEKLQSQEAARMNVAVSDQDVADAVARIESGNRMEKGQLATVLERAGIPISTLEQQVRASLAWTRLVQRRLRAQIEIPDEEVKEVLERLKNSRGGPEFLLSEMFLPVDSPDQEDDVRKLAERLIEQMRRGAPFPALAQQFSKAASAARGGDLGWVPQGQLDEDIENVIAALSTGQLSEPIRTVGGYYLYGLRARRSLAGASPEDAQISLTQLILPARNPAETRSSMQIAETVASAVQGCDDLTTVAREIGVTPPAPPQSLRVGDVNPQIRNAVAQLKAGQASQPLRGSNAIVILMVCTRQDADAGLPTAEDVQENLTRQRLDLQARRYLRDLRRIAYVDIRA
jgi:peptidyl-prolyl cis-trans isomerase SurA